MMTETGRHFTAFVVPHTHWDREWYEPFQVFRARLVDVIDRVLKLLENPAYLCFTLDGQAVILEDYLAVRPERAADLQREVQAGRLRIGPWYVLADEFLVSPEALLRNLMLGRRVCRDFGEPMPVAYTPDSFGHISQLPLIAKGFGLDAVVFERGVGDEGERLRGEFRWLAADGHTEVFAVHLLGTYSGAAALGHVDWELTDAYDKTRAQEHMRAALYGVRGDGVAELPTWFRESLERVRGGLTSYATSDALLLLNGSDHLFPQSNLPEVLQHLSDALPDVAFIQSDVESFVEAAWRPLENLETYQGEFRGSRYQHVLSGVLSSRLYLKRANDETETLLERYAEPLSALVWAAGGGYPEALLWTAWRLLLLNHPHDSICGCSVDSVHREMMTRFAGAEELGSDLCRRAFQKLVGNRPTNLQEVNALGAATLTVFNPLPFSYEAVVEHTLELPLADKSLAVHTLDGGGVPHQLEVEESFAPGRSDRKQAHVGARFLATLPPLGLASFRLEAFEGNSPGSDLHASHDGDALRLENSRLALTVGAEGDLYLNDKRSGLDYNLPLYFEDRGDAGDEYDFSPVAGDEPQRLVRPKGAPRLLLSGPVSATVGLEYALTLPERLSPDRKTRLGSTLLPIRLELTLNAASAVLGLKVRLANMAQDHRLRLCIASGVRSDKVWAGGSFDFLERPVRPSEGVGWFQKPQPTNHQRHALALSDGAKGLALFNRGLSEYEAVPSEKGVDLAVTLLRAVGWLSREDLLSRPQGAGPSLPTPEAQCLGDHTFDLALYLFAGDWWTSDLLRELQIFTAPPRPFTGGAVTDAATLFELYGPLVLSSVKRAEDRDSLIVRVFNPAPVVARGRLSVKRRVLELYRTRLDETRLKGLTVQPEISLTLAAKSVETVEFVLAKGGDDLESDDSKRK